MADRDVAQLLLEAARHDLGACKALASMADIHDSMVGFHAQQAIEKSLKAVLAHAGVAVRRTHDIAELLDATADSGLPSPPHAEQLDEFQPYAVEARYGLVQPGALNRARTTSVVEEVWSWAAGQIE